MCRATQIWMQASGDEAKDVVSTLRARTLANTIAPAWTPGIRAPVGLARRLTTTGAKRTRLPAHPERDAVVALRKAEPLADASQNGWPRGERATDDDRGN